MKGPVAEEIFRLDGQPVRILRRFSPRERYVVVPLHESHNAYNDDMPELTMEQWARMEPNENTSWVTRAAYKFARRLQGKKGD